jgi:DNA polymerase-3 subunit delta'
MQFQDVAGQSQIKHLLVRSAQQGRIPHAQLFSGKHGHGTLPIALAYIQYLLCEQPSPQDSCGACAGCKKVGKLSHPDLHFVFPFPADKSKLSTDLMEPWRKALNHNPYMTYSDWMRALYAEKKQGNIPISEVRDIFRRLSLKSFEAEYKIMVLWLPEYLGQSGNALLKLIEEPPEKTLFLLVCENVERVLATIISRTQPVRIPPIGTTELTHYLTEIMQVAPNDAQRISVMSHGSFRLAQELLTEAESPYFEQWRNWMALCYTRKIGEATVWADNMAANGKEMLKGFFLYGLEVLRGVLVSGYVAELNTWTGKEKEFIERFSQLEIPSENIEKMVTAIETSLMHIERNANVKVVLTDLSFVMTRNLKK